MLKSKLAKAFIFSICLTVLSSGTALASSGDAKTSSAQVQQTGSEAEIFQKQQEIDRYVFEQNKDEFAKRGITVTHTSPMNGYVEIGITPYNPENADYLYEVFGRDKVKVVEGIQAVTMQISTASAGNNDTPVSKAAQAQLTAIDSKLLQKQKEIDSYVFEQHKDEIAAKGFSVTTTGPIEGYVQIGITPYSEENADYLYEIFGRENVQVVDGLFATTMEVPTTSANSNEDKVTTTSVNDNAEAAKNSSSIPNTLLYTLAGLGLLGGTVLVVKKAVKR